MPCLRLNEDANTIQRIHLRTQPTLHRVGAVKPLSAQPAWRKRRVCGHQGGDASLKAQVTTGSKWTAVFLRYPVSPGCLFYPLLPSQEKA